MKSASVCPVCGSTDVDITGGTEDSDIKTGEVSLTQDCYCLDCNAFWYAEWTKLEIIIP